MTTSKYFTNCCSEEFVWQKGKPLENAYKECDKNHHDQFFDITELKDRLPEKYKKDDDLIRQAEQMASLTVRLIVQENKTDLRYGSGFIQRVRRGRGDKCPDKTCQHGKPGHSWGVFTVTTVHHVVKSQEEAESVEIFLIENGCTSTGTTNTTLRGYKLLETDKDGGRFDWCAVECVTHNMNLVGEFETALSKFEELQKSTYQKYKSKKEKLVIMIGHPHGGPQKVSFGEWTDKQNLKDVRSTQNWCQYRHKAHSCPGNSGSPVLILGQPLCGYGYWFGHPHNHSAWDPETKLTLTSIGADNVVNDSS